MKFHIINQQVQCIPNKTIPPLSKMSLRENMDLYYVIQRFKRGRSKNQIPVLGDNCPFLYGLKQLDGLRVTPEYQTIFYEIATECVKQYFQAAFPFDYMVLLPSSHQISHYWATQLAYPAPILSHILRKKTNQEIREEVFQLYQEKQMNQKIYEIITQNCAENHAVFSLKNIPVPYRKWTKPFALNNTENIDLNGKNILLVDDICSSGTSLLMAADLLQQQYQPHKIDALTLFGKVPK